MPKAKDDTIRTYDAIHELYDAETTDFWEKFPLVPIREFVRRLPGKNVVDLGSGPGRDAILLRDEGLNVTCVDGSGRMVEATRRMEFKSFQQDLRKLDLEPGSFHGAWAYSSLIHLTFDESREILRKVYEILAPGGLFFIGLIQGEGNEFRNVAGSDMGRYFEYYSAEKFNRLIMGLPYQPIYGGTFRPKNHTYLNYMIRKV